MNTTETKLTDVCAALGINIEASLPSPGMDRRSGKASDDWPHILYSITIKRNGRPIWSGPYKLGIGHVDYSENSKLTLGSRAQARLASELALIQKVTPQLDDVMGSLISDGSPHFNHETFEDWCENLGYNDDSIRDLQSYNTCMAIGIALAKAFTADELTQLQTAASNH